ncbi:sporulation integral membrane protein YtvI [Halobacillus sp. A5]|uniref:sporulation integral membrane protein YtvI n=1 Tax=Halobacillus sp. A5 TaxID=2880263 RepID=UPI0020A6565C|nr:sporulation integral membrane protein YtvI [Halobacillus sp. A5]MCP3025459.1 sporulation integral membrane protein YtvI [Halobacillus sp. A5]
MDSLNIQQLARLSIVLLCVTIIYFFIYFLWNFLFPFILALAFSWMVQPLVHLLHRKARLPKSLAIMIILSLIVLIFFTIFAAVITRFVGMIQELSNQDFIGYVHTINVFHNQFLNWIDFILTYVKEWVSTISPTFSNSVYEYLDEFKHRLVQFGIEQLQSLLQLFSGVLGNLPKLFITCTIALISTFFISKDWDRMTRFFYEQFSSKLRSPLRTIASNFKHTLKQVIKAQLILMLITMILVFIGMLFIQYPHPLLITLIAGVIDFIPYIGTGVIFVPWIFYSFITNEYGLTIQLSIIYMTIIISRQLLEPKILAVHFGIHPLVLLIGLFLGFQIWGGMTIIITPILIALLKAMHSSGVPAQLWHYIKGN